MLILAIETSCDETAISIVEAKGGLTKPEFKIIAHLVSSQIALHNQWGGVVPMLAKREHGRNLIPLFQQALITAKLLAKTKKNKAKADKDKRDKGWSPQQIKSVSKILEREPELQEQFLNFLPQIRPPRIGAIAVTRGPGLEPALWVGINFARSLVKIWNLPLIPVNHLEGHILAPLVDKQTTINFPALALIVSGGHTELVLIKNWLKYQIIGQTRDDAVGEAFDKVARLLGLPYPGGPAISQLAKQAKIAKLKNEWSLPRPMLNSSDFDFSFSGLKTAVLYLIKKLPTLTNQDKMMIAAEFEQAAVEVLIAKTSKAIAKFNPKTFILGGGVSANQALREQLTKQFRSNYPKLKLLLPNQKLSTDNATMIALAGYLRQLKNPIAQANPNIKASGNLPL